MLRSKTARFSAVALGSIIMCAVATEARAQLAPALTAPLSCTLTLAGAQLTIETVPMGTPPTFPNDVPCPGGTGTCSEFNYRFAYAGGNLSHSFLSVSADLGIFAANPDASIEVGGLPLGACAGDTTSKVGLNVCEQRQIRFNEAGSTVNSAVIVTRSAPRVSTAGARKGSAEAFCLIQGPGVPGGAFATVTAKSTIVVVHGQCSADVTKGPDGGFTSLTLPVGSPCTLTVLDPGVPFLLDGQPITFTPGGSNSAGLNSCWYALVNGRNTRLCGP